MTTQQWLPISSAPKTNHAILVWCPERMNIYCVTWDAANGFWTPFGAMDTIMEEPTHWQPLPPPPGESQ